MEAGDEFGQNTRVQLRNWKKGKGVKKAKKAKKAAKGSKKVKAKLANLRTKNEKKLFKSRSIIVKRTNPNSGRMQRSFRTVMIDGKPANDENIYTITKTPKGTWPSPGSAAAKQVSWMRRDGRLLKDKQGSYRPVQVTLEEVTKGASGKMYSYVVKDLQKGQGKLLRDKNGKAIKDANGNEIKFMHSLKVISGSKVSYL